MCPLRDAREVKCVTGVEIVANTARILLASLAHPPLIVTSMSDVRFDRLIVKSRSRFSVGTRAQRRAGRSAEVPSGSLCCWLLAQRTQKVLVRGSDYVIDGTAVAAASTQVPGTITVATPRIGGPCPPTPEGRST